MKAIQTRYLGATNTRPSRIKASAEGVPPITYTCEELKSSVHEAAAERFAIANNWPANLASGGLPNGDYAHCFKS